MLPPLLPFQSSLLLFQPSLLLFQPPEQLQGLWWMCCCSCPGRLKAWCCQSRRCVSVQQYLLQGFTAVTQCLQELHPLCHQSVMEQPGICSLISWFYPFYLSLSTGAEGCQQQCSAPWDNQMKTSCLKGKFSVNALPMQQSAGRAKPRWAELAPSESDSSFRKAPPCSPGVK